MDMTSLADRNDHEAHEVYLALLRGVNVGGKNKLPMSLLVEMFTRAGCTDVRTFIQSGNIVFRADKELYRRIPEVIARAIKERSGLSVPVITRTAAEWRSLLGSNPFIAAGADPEKLHVVFLADEPNEVRMATLDPHRSAPDQFIVRGAEIFQSNNALPLTQASPGAKLFPQGFGQSRLNLMT